MSTFPAMQAEQPTRRGDSRRRITHAAMDLFERQGYAATTVDAIAEAAGVSRRTFFHHFASKDAVVFPDHEHLVERVDAHLRAQPTADPIDAVASAIRLVLASYLADPEVALRRYQLTRTTPELREREVAWVQRYQLLFSRYLGECWVDAPQGALAADVVAAGASALHNHVLRHWLKGGGQGDAMTDLDVALAWWRRSAVAEPRADAPRRVVVAVFDEDVDPAELAAHVREARSALDG
jgi:AcrR family transcriptional regulator